MSSICAGSRNPLRNLVVAFVIAVISCPAFAQEPSDPAPHALTVAAGIDFANQYMFRGVRQNSTGMAVWPSADLTARVLSREGLLRRVEVSAGFWNSLNTGDTGSGGPIDRPWYESRLSGTVGVQFGRGVSFASTYTAYTSPNDMFATVKEIGVSVAIDDRRALGVTALRPYAFLAFEIDTSPGMGQLDGGLTAGRYLELGASPGYSGRRAGVSFPIKVGLSLRDYYELGAKDNRLGFVSVGSIVTVPLGQRSRVGRWNIRGGVEFQSLGETTKVFNGGDRSAAVASFGLALKP